MEKYLKYINRTIRIPFSLSVNKENVYIIFCEDVVLFMILCSSYPTHQAIQPSLRLSCITSMNCGIDISQNSISFRISLDRKLLSPVKTISLDASQGPKLVLNSALKRQRL